LNGIPNQITKIHPDRLYLWKGYITRNSCKCDDNSYRAKLCQPY
jgi:hypothetical protein